jgi:hypothetical protein
MTTEVIVHHLAQAKAVLNVARELDLTVQLRSSPGAAAYAGVGFLRALGDAAGQALIIDCDDDPGLAMAALRSGSKQLLFAGSSDLLRRVKQIAARSGGQVRDRADVSVPLVALSPDDDENEIRRVLAPKAAS